MNHSNGDQNNLTKGESTDMLVHLLGNTEKLVDSTKRWNYNDHRDEKSSARSDENDDLDEDIASYVDDEAGVFGKESEQYPSENTQQSERNTDYDNSDNQASNFSTQENTNQNNNQQNQQNNEQNRPKTKEEIMLEKLNMLRKLGELKQCGVNLSQNYNLDSDLKMMEYEYKLHHDIRSKQNSVQWMSHMLIGCTKGIEILNDNYNPFDIKLNGLSNKINSDMQSYYAVLGDIYEKYNKPGKEMAPEMRLFLMISGAALSMQASRFVPEMIGGMASSIKGNDTELNKYRAIAEQNTKNAMKAEQEGQQKVNEYLQKQHADAAQKAADIKMLQEREAEYNKMQNMFGNSNNDRVNKFKQNMLISTESPGEENNETKELTQDEINYIKRVRQMKEREHLEAMRQKARQRSEMYRNASSGASNNNFVSDKQRKDLLQQNRQLDNILNGLNNNSFNHPDMEKTITTKKSDKKSSRRSDRRSERYSDNKSTASNASSISINPDFADIIKNTSKKAFRESEKKSLPKQKVKQASNTKKRGRKKKETISESIRYSSADSNTESKSKSKTSSFKTLTKESYESNVETSKTGTGDTEQETIEETVDNTVEETVEETVSKRDTEMSDFSSTSSEKKRKNNKREKLNKAMNKASENETDLDALYDNAIDNLLKNNDEEDQDLDTDHISIGSKSKSIKSSKSKKKSEKNFVNFGSISIGSKNKGERIILGIGGPKNGKK